MLHSVLEGKDKTHSVNTHTQKVFNDIPTMSPCTHSKTKAPENT